MKPAAGGGEDPKGSLSSSLHPRATQREGRRGLHLQEARGVRHVAEHSQPAGFKVYRQVPGGQEVGFWKELPNPRSHSPGRSLLPAVKPRDRGKVARKASLPAHRDTFFGDQRPHLWMRELRLRGKASRPPVQRRCSDSPRSEAESWRPATAPVPLELGDRWSPKRRMVEEGRECICVICCEIL